MAIKLKVAAKKKWLEALRSGEYEQGIGKLRGNKLFYDMENGVLGMSDTYCCLGVARGALNLKTPYSNPKLFVPDFKSMCQAKTVPAGKAGRIAIDDVQDKLITMNDEKMNSFKQIANWIEKNL